MPKSVPHPAVSVLIATYNYASTLPRAIDGLLEQTFPMERMEILVIDDGSADGTEKAVKAYSKPVRYIQQTHQGLPAACNLGIQKAGGDFLIRVDADDTVDKTLVEKEYGAFDSHPDAAFIFSDHLEINGNDSRWVHLSAENLYGCIASGILFRMDELKTVGGYRGFFWEEYDLFLRLRQRFPDKRPIHIAEPLYHYRRHAGSMVSNAQQRVEGWKAMIREWGIDRLRQIGHLEELEETWKSLHNAGVKA